MTGASKPSSSAARQIVRVTDNREGRELRLSGSYFMLFFGAEIRALLPKKVEAHATAIAAESEPR